MRRSHLFIIGRQKLIPILFCGLFACCVKNSPTPLMTCNDLAKAKPLTRVHIRATISLTTLLTYTARSNDADTYCYVPIGCGSNQLFLLLKRGDGRNNVYVPFDLRPNIKPIERGFDLSRMEVRTAEGKAATTGATIDIEGDLKNGKPSGTLQEIVYIENPEIHFVPASSPVTIKP
jgi:hypothetical protein